MDRIVDLVVEVQRTLADFAKGGDFKAKSYILHNTASNIYSMITIPDTDHPLINKPQIIILVQVADQHVIVHQDITDRPLYQELMRCGIPREQIILAYAGEKPPDSDAPEQ